MNEKPTAPNLTVGVATTIQGPITTSQEVAFPFRKLLSLTEKQFEELTKKAAERGISVQEVVRQILDKHLFGEI